MIAGILAADLTDTVPPAWPMAALLATTLAACFVRARFPFLLSLGALFLVWGALSVRPFLRPVDALGPFAGNAPIEIEGVVDARVETPATGGSRVYLQVERVVVADRERCVRGRLLVYVKRGRVELAAGDRVVFLSRIRKPRPLGLPGEADYARRLAYQRVFATGFVPEAEDLVLLRAGAGWRHEVDLLAGRLGRLIMRAEPGTEGGVLKALLLGDRGDVPEQVQESFARSGVNHILSISGFHVGILFLSLFQGLYFAARRSEWLALHLKLRQVILLLSLPVVVFYLFLSGQAPATLRSVLMISALVASLQLKRELDPVNTIMLAACAILFSAPETLFDVSFQLSFLAIWGLTVLAPPLGARLDATRKGLRWLPLLFIASAAAILATVVHVAYYFQRVSLTGLLANLVVVPLLGYGAVVAGFLALAASCIGTVPAVMLLHAAALPVRWSVRVVEYLSAAPVWTGYVPDRIDLLLACLTLCAVTFLASNVRRWGAAAVLILVLCLRTVPASSAPERTLHLYFLSVGQGDAALVHLPDGKWMLVDGGGNATDAEVRVGPRLLLPALRALAVRRLDYVALSHEHPDHLQGVLYLAAYFDVGEFLCSPLLLQSPEARQLRWVLSARAVPVRELHPEQGPVAVGGAVLKPLWPLTGASAGADEETDAGRTGRGFTRRDANDTSLVFTLVHGKSRVLFTGDLGERGERTLLQRGALERCSILKVGHHGSRYSSSASFLSAVHPEACVISSGYRNTFGLPSPVTVERLKRQGIPIYRTDMDGTVESVCTVEGVLTISTPWGHFN